MRRSPTIVARLARLLRRPSSPAASGPNRASEALNMTLKIDDAFIREWHPRYERTECDEPDYQLLLKAVKEDMRSTGTISKDTFRRIWKWKKAARRMDLVRMDEYDPRYAEAFRRAASEPPERKLDALLASNVKLPGIGAPTGSTLLHFMHPDCMPIIDVRTVEVLFRAGYVSTKQRDLRHYQEFRSAIESIRQECPGWSLREIDRALFAYHKQALGKTKHKRSRSHRRVHP